MKCVLWLKAVVVWWMMTYLESSENVPYMQGAWMAAEQADERLVWVQEYNLLCFNEYDV